MSLYEIKDYVKLLCIIIDRIENYVINEINTFNDRKAEDFIKLYKNRKD